MGGEGRSSDKSGIVSGGGSLNKEYNNARTRGPHVSRLNQGALRVVARRGGWRGQGAFRGMVVCSSQFGWDPSHQRGGGDGGGEAFRVIMVCSSKLGWDLSHHRRATARRLPSCIYIYIYTNTYKYIQIHTNTYKYIPIHTNTYKHIQIHTNT